MEKVDLSTANIATENAAKLAELFPDVLTEVMDEDGNVHYGIDAEALRAHVGDIAEGKRERYQFTWPGKQRARAEAIRQIDKTMRPVPEESVNWDTTENLYIEGDNLDALKILRETYAGKIKMIYIDPPYNTGHDFVYNDSFARSAEEERAESGAFDEEGNLLDTYAENRSSDGRFHSNWCSMIYPRLVLARDLLSDDGSIFISIDDNELFNLLKIMNEVFSEGNFVADIVWQKKYAATNDAKGFSTTHDYILVWSKSIESYDRNLLPRTAEQNAPYKHDDGDGRGLWRSDNLLVKTFSQSGVYPIVNPNTGVEYLPPKGSCWRASKETMATWLLENRIYFGKDGLGAPQLKRYLNEVKQGRVPITWWTWEECGHNDAANKEVKSLFDGMVPFDTPKPTALLKQILTIGSNSDSVVLDFFSGSATLADAVMQLNAEDRGSRSYILVQIPEPCSEKSVGGRAGYKNICEIGKERIRRAGTKIAAEVEQANAQLKLGEEPKKVPDIGFRVLKIDSSNFRDVKSTPDAIQQDQLFGMADNLKPDRTPEDILFQLFPQFEIPFTARIEKLSIGGKTVYSVDDDTLLACFDREVSEDVIRAMATRQPLRAVLRDASFIGDDALTNFEEIFKTLSPSTETRVV